MSKRLIATVLAASLALTSVSAAPARAADSGEIARFIFGAGALLMLGQALSKNDRNRNVTRRYDYDQDYHVYTPPRPRKILPSACLRVNRFDNGPRRFFGRPCLRNNNVRIGRLPNQCKRTIWTYNGKRTVFAARCLRRNGWTLG